MNAVDLCEHQWVVWETMLARFAAGAVGMTRVKQTVTNTDFSIIKCVYHITS